MPRYRANDLRELDTTFRGIVVGSRQIGRSNQDREDWQALALTYDLARSGRLAFPIELESDTSKSPDCVLTEAGKSVGLEATEIVPFWLKRALERNEALGTGASVDVSRFDFDASWTESALVDYLQKGGTPHVAHRGTSRTLEFNLANYVNDIVAKKTVALNATDNGLQRYTHYQRNWLIMYASHHASAIPSIVGPRLATPPSGTLATFDRIFLRLGSSHLLAWPKLEHLDLTTGVWN
jgi:hypothetical protein